MLSACSGVKGGSGPAGQGAPAGGNTQPAAQGGAAGGSAGSGSAAPGSGASGASGAPQFDQNGFVVRGPAAKKGGTVTVLGSSPFSHLDPARGNDGNVNNFYNLI